MRRLIYVGLLWGMSMMAHGAWAGDELASHPVHGKEIPPRHEVDHHQPPPEAFAACQAKSKGAACDVDTPDGTLKGVCMAPENKALACTPKHLPRGPQGERPPAPPTN